MTPNGSYNSSFSLLGLLHAKANSFQLTAILAKDNQARKNKLQYYSCCPKKKLGQKKLTSPFLAIIAGFHIKDSQAGRNQAHHHCSLPRRKVARKATNQTTISLISVKLRRPFLTIIAGFLGRQLGRKVQAHHHCSLPRREVARKGLESEKLSVHFYQTEENC